MKPLLHLWSLGVEEQFYLTYPFVLWLIWRSRRGPLAAVSLLAVASLLLCVWKTPRDPVGAFFSPQTRWWELMMGCCVACWRLPSNARAIGQKVGIFGRFSPRVLRDVASGLGVILVLFAVFYVRADDAFPGWRALIPVAGAAVTIAAGGEAWLNRRFLASRPMVFVGLISYPLYLWHWPVLTFPRILRGGETTVAVRTAGILLSFSLAVVTWRYVEKPARFGRKTWIKTASLVTASILMGVLGYAAKRDGFSARFPVIVKDLGDLQRVEWATPQCLEETSFGRLDYCRVTGSQPPDVVLLGDSHAAVLYDGVAEDYRKRSQTLMNLGQAGCVPFFDTDSFSPGGRKSSCQPAVNRVLDFATNASSVQTLILSFRDARYMAGVGFGAVDAASADKRIAWAGAPAGSDQAAIFKASLENTIARLSATGKKMILVLDWPELGFDPRSCLPRPVTLFSSPRPLCGVPREQVELRNRDYRQICFEMEKKFRQLEVLDPFPYLCDSRNCYAMQDGHLLYSDSDHISQAGAAYLSGKFFEKALP